MTDHELSKFLRKENAFLSLDLHNANIYKNPNGQVVAIVVFNNSKTTRKVLVV